MRYDVIIVGGGPAGMMAAGSASMRGAKVLLLEKKERPGRKLRITGKGRCNITNMRPWEEFSLHIRANACFLRPSFERMDNNSVVKFMNGIGLPTILERGERVFPLSNVAGDVTDALVKWCRSSGVEMKCGEEVIRVVAQRGAVAGVESSRGQYLGKSVIIATGGASYPATGSTGDGYRMAYELGHDIEPLRPSLVALYSSHAAMPMLRGVMLKNVKASLVADSSIVAEEFGEVEFLQGRSSRSVIEIAGAAVLRLSRTAVDAIIEHKKVELTIDLKPALALNILADRIEREIVALGPTGRVDQLLRKLLPQGMVAVAAGELKLSEHAPISSIDGRMKESLVLMLKGFTIPLTDYAPIEEAIVTAGGVDVSRVNPDTLESNIVKGLYFAGELLDIDGDTGGYNIQIALSTGYSAGIAAVRNR